MEWSKVKKLCNQEIERNTNICIDPENEEKEKVVAGGEIRAYRIILNLENNGPSQNNGEQEWPS